MSPRVGDPLERIDRRVLGVLIEKGKTTPDNYPLSLNSLRSGCNQKSNRFPLMDVSEDDVEESIERLREIGALAVIQGDSRVDKYRHLAYEWLGVDKLEIAVMAELLLRGAQTLGELRGRAVRMEKGHIKDLSELRPIVDRLVDKKLVVFLTPSGRGAVVSHTLYLPKEFEKVQREFGTVATTPSSPPSPSPSNETQSNPHPHVEPPEQVPSTPDRPSREAVASSGDSSRELTREVAQLRSQLASLREEMNELRDEATTAISDVRRALDQLNQDLGNP